MAHPAFELQQRIEGSCRQGLKLGLLGCEGLRHPLRRAVQAHIGDARQPVPKLLVEVVQVAEGAAEEEVLPNVGEGALHFALRLAR